MGKDPAMLFYTSDFLTGVALMSMKERGQYITLLCLQQQRGHMKEEEMRKVVGDLSEELMSKFVIDEEGKYYNKRAEIEIQKRASHIKKQRENINKRWGKRDEVGINDGNTTVCTTVCTTEIPLENENENIQDNLGIEDKPKLQEEDRGCGGKGKDSLSFDEFWSAWPKNRRKGKQDARKAFNNIPQKDKPLLLPAIERDKKSRQWQEDGGQFIPWPQKWLNHRLYLDDSEEADDATDQQDFEWYAARTRIL